MGFVVGIIITAVGFILALAVHPTDTDSVNVNTVGWILVVVGLIAFFADLVLWSSWRPGYPRRTYVEQVPGYGAGPARDRGRRTAPDGTGLLENDARSRLVRTATLAEVLVIRLPIGIE